MSSSDSEPRMLCFEEDVLKLMFREMTEGFKEKYFEGKSPWINEKEAMELLKIKSKTTFINYQNEGNIIRSEVSGKHILYNRNSILKFIESKIK